MILRGHVHVSISQYIAVKRTPGGISEYRRMCECPNVVATTEGAAYEFPHAIFQMMGHDQASIQTVEAPVDFGLHEGEHMLSDRGGPL
jgi:hypothetical protein